MTRICTRCGTPFGENDLRTRSLPRNNTHVMVGRCNICGSITIMDVRDNTVELYEKLLKQYQEGKEAAVARKDGPEIKRFGDLAIDMQELIKRHKRRIVANIPQEWKEKNLCRN